MKAKSNIIILGAVYVVISAVLMTFSILFSGFIEMVLITIYGIINIMYLYKFIKIEVIKSIILGLFISSFSMVFIYVLWYFSVHQNPIIAIFIYIITNLLGVYIVQRQKEIKPKWIYGTLLFLTIVSVKATDSFSKIDVRYGSETIIKTIKIINEKDIPIEKISVSLVSQPLFNLQRLHDMREYDLNKNNQVNINLYSGYDYQIYLYDKNGKIIQSQHISLKNDSSKDIYLEIR